jgi:RNA polymerase sigma factor (sigma-70 family)
MAVGPVTLRGAAAASESQAAQAAQAAQVDRDAQLERLVAALRNGGVQAREAILEHANERLLRLTRRMLRQYPQLRRWEATDDVQQNALLRLYRSLAEVEVESARHFLNLAGTQIRRELIDLKRHYFGPQGMAANHHTDHRPADEVGAALDRNGEPEDLTSWTTFHEACERLPDVEREVVTLLYYQGLSQQAAADMLGVSLRTVKRRWFSAREMLHNILGPEANRSLAGSPHGEGGDDDPRTSRRGAAARPDPAVGGAAGEGA